MPILCYIITMKIEGCIVDIEPDLQNPAWRVTIDGHFASRFLQGVEKE